ncbi:hypothetical protein [Spiroplasma endosymbiont of Polydrusus formosus]
MPSNTSYGSRSAIFSRVSFNQAISGCCHQNNLLYIPWAMTLQ